MTHTHTHTHTHRALYFFAGAVPVAKGVAKAKETISARPHPDLMERTGDCRGDAWAHDRCLTLNANRKCNYWVWFLLVVVSGTTCLVQEVGFSVLFLEWWTFLATIGQTIPRCRIVLAFDRIHVVLDCVGIVDCVGCTDDLNLHCMWLRKGTQKCSVLPNTTLRWHSVDFINVWM